MTGKKTDLDDATVRIVRKVLAMPPKHHDEMKVRAPKKMKGKEGPANQKKIRRAKSGDQK